MATDQKSGYVNNEATNDPGTLIAKNFKTTTKALTRDFFGGC